MAVFALTSLIVSAVTDERMGGAVVLVQSIESLESQVMGELQNCSKISFSQTKQIWNLKLVDRD
jgi:hypothetical protein